MADTPAYSTASPVFTVDGTRQGDLARDLVRLDVEESAEGLRRLTAHLLGNAPRVESSNDVVEYLDGKVIDFGKKLQVALGPTGTEKIVFTGVVSALQVEFAEGDAPTIVVYAEDELMRLRLTQRSATYVQVSDADLVRAIASKHGLSAKPDADGPTYDVVQQFNQSDLAFLRERARRIRAELWADDGALRLTTRDRRPGTSVTLTRGGDLISLTARADLSEQCTAVRVYGLRRIVTAGDRLGGTGLDDQRRDLRRPDRSADAPEGVRGPARAAGSGRPRRGVGGASVCARGDARPITAFRPGAWRHQRHPAACRREQGHPGALRPAVRRWRLLRDELPPQLRPAEGDADALRRRTTDRQLRLGPRGARGHDRDPTSGQLDWFQLLRPLSRDRDRHRSIASG